METREQDLCLGMTYSSRPDVQTRLGLRSKWPNKNTSGNGKSRTEESTLYLPFSFTRWILLSFIF